MNDNMKVAFWLHVNSYAKALRKNMPNVNIFMPPLALDKKEPPHLIP